MFRDSPQLHAAWVAIVRETMENQGGRIPDAARTLGVSTRTLFRWLEDPAFLDVPRVGRGIRRE